VQQLRSKGLALCWTLKNKLKPKTPVQQALQTKGLAYYWTLKHKWKEKANCITKWKAWVWPSAGPSKVNPHNNTTSATIEKQGSGLVLDPKK
jgi:hypothetical protein